MKRIKVICLSVVLVICLTFISTATFAISASKAIEKKVFRLHVIGESNSVDDQIVKYKVRDEIISKSEIYFKDARNSDQAKIKAQENLNKFLDAANSVLQNNGSEKRCRAFVENRFFPTKEYENNIVLPAGNYDALVIIIGEGKGENWWCVMFPQICLSGAVNTKMKDVLKGDELELTKKPKTKSAKIKFKTVELYNMLVEGIKEIV